MERIWAPWRLEYITGEKVDGCIFCVFPSRNSDEASRILARGKHAYVIMNAFPYSNGHLLVAPYRHIADFGELNEDESLEIMRLGQTCCAALKTICRPDGFNIGWNIGTAAGAGIAGHVHMHIVPRWNGDTNFMPVLADVKVIPEALDVTYAKLKEEFGRLAG
jgi:ATP adenylyltransferase